MLAWQLGVTPERIIYANPCKAPSHIHYAKDQVGRSAARRLWADRRTGSDVSYQGHYAHGVDEG